MSCNKCDFGKLGSDCFIPCEQYYKEKTEKEYFHTKIKVMELLLELEKKEDFYKDEENYKNLLLEINK